MKQIKDIFGELIQEIKNCYVEDTTAERVLYFHNQLERIPEPFKGEFERLISLLEVVYTVPAGTRPIRQTPSSSQSHERSLSEKGI